MNPIQSDNPTATILARISNDVMDDADFPVCKLTINQIGTVVGAEMIHVPDDYSHSTAEMPQVGWTIEKLQQWGCNSNYEGRVTDPVREFNTPTGAYFSDTYKIHMMEKLVRHAFDVEGMVLLQPWCDGVNPVGYSLHNTNQERLNFFKEVVADHFFKSHQTLTPARSPYLMHPDRVGGLRNLLIEGELPSYKQIPPIHVI